MGKAPNGYGSIRKITKGRYKGQWRVAVTVGWYGAGRPRRKTGIFEKWSDADAFRQDWAERRRTGAIGPAGLTVSVLLSHWLENVVTPNRAENTAASYGYAIRNHIVPHLGSVRLEQLHPRTIETWLAELLSKGAGDRTRQNAYTVLSAALSQAVRRGDLASNPCLRVEKPQARRQKVDPFLREEIDWILADSFEGRYAALFRLAVSTGMRQGELFGLRPRDVDLRSATVSITRQAVECAGRIVLQAYPKTDASNRTLSLTDATCILLGEHRKAMLRRGRAGREFEFVASEGGVIRRSTFGSRIWRPMLERLEIRHRGFHHVRHSFATVMLGDGVPLHVVARIMGHARPSVTSDLYAHAIPDQIGEAVESAQRLFG
jgi:integrase